MSLKKALGKLKPGSLDNASDSSIQLASDADSSRSGAVPNGSNSFNNGATPKPNHSPRASQTFSTFTRASTDRSDHDGHPPKRASSLRNSGLFSRGDKTNGSTSRIKGLKDKLRITSESSSEVDEPLNRDGEKMSKSQLKKAMKQAEKEKRMEENDQREKQIMQRRQEMQEKARRHESKESRARYGVLPTNRYAGKWSTAKRLNLRDMNEKMVGKEIMFRARIHAIRRMSAHLTFYLFRQQTITVQGVLQESDKISEFFMFWADRLDIESVVLVKGIVQVPQAKEGEVIGATIHKWEVVVEELHVEGKLSEHLPFSVQEAEITKREALQEGENRRHVPDRVRMNNRILDLRTTASQSIFRIQSGISRLFREYLDTQGFVEIHTPKLQGGATESGASVFKVEYFGRPAFLAQSPQLAKQMCISADFNRVYEIGAVFRAENSNTHRHMTEYTGLDLEMAIDSHYHEVLNMLDNTFKSIFRGIYEKYRHEIDIVKKHFPHEDLVWIGETPRIPFAEGIQMLNESGWRDDQGKELDPNEDLGTRDEIQLGKLVRQKYGTDYYILDKFPIGARPFYAMPDPNNGKLTNSFDIFLRGQEILSGGQRIHDAELLIKRMEALKMDPFAMEEYMQGFEWGAPPHGGGGIGLERMLMLLLSLGDIRHATLFPRDPKSFPSKPAIAALRHPDASTLHPPWEGRDRMTACLDFQPLEKLIANYGDATNTSWLEERTRIWRDNMTGAAVGYVPQDGFAITVGDPLCDSTQYVKTIAGFLRFVKRETGLKPLWLLVGPEVEEVLADKFNWRTFSVAAEQRINPSRNPAIHDSEVMRKVRKAEKEGVKIVDIKNGDPVPHDLRGKIDARVKDWLANRKGKQVHLTNIHPWQDMEHRRYHYATDKSGETIVALVVLAMLSPAKGWQIKYSLDFPGAPSGAIEAIIMHSTKALAAEGETNATFGGGASATFTPGKNMKSAKAKILSKAYHTIVTELKLTNKSEFREKLGAKEDPVFIGYPPHGLGPSGVKAILGFFEDD